MFTANNLLTLNQFKKTMLVFSSQNFLFKDRRNTNLYYIGISLCWRFNAEYNFSNFRDSLLIVHTYYTVYLILQYYTCTRLNCSGTVFCTSIIDLELLTTKNEIK